MTRYNFSAKTLDDAITKACVELGITSDMLDYIVTEQGTNGVLGLGIGARPWVISAGRKEEPAEEVILPEEEEEAAEACEEPCSEEKAGEVKEAAAEKAECDNAPEENAVSGAECIEKAEAFLKSVFESMGMEVNIKSSYDEMLSELSVDLFGDDMGVLIGKRGQTLDSLQYLTGQVINKHNQNYVRVKLDTENYRERRREALETLAQNMAHKVRRTKHAMALEPMNPYERRIIHSTLQDEKDIITRSEGEEPYRHVVVCFVKHKK